MTAAIIALASAFVAAIGYIIWSRIRIGKLHDRVTEVTIERDHAVRDAELAIINLRTAESNIAAAEEAKARAELAATRLRTELNDVLTMVAEGKLGDASAVRAKLDKLLSQ